MRKKSTIISAVGFILASIVIIIGCGPHPPPQPPIVVNAPFTSTNIEAPIYTATGFFFDNQINVFQRYIPPASLNLPALIPEGALEIHSDFNDDSYRLSVWDGNAYLTIGDDNGTAEIIRDDYMAFSPNLPFIPGGGGGGNGNGNGNGPPGCLAPPGQDGKADNSQVTVYWKPGTADSSHPVLVVEMDAVMSNDQFGVGTIHEVRINMLTDTGAAAFQVNGEDRDVMGRAFYAREGVSLDTTPPVVTATNIPAPGDGTVWSNFRPIVTISEQLGQVVAVVVNKATPDEYQVAYSSNISAQSDASMDYLFFPPNGLENCQNYTFVIATGLDGFEPSWLIGNPNMVITQDISGNKLECSNEIDMGLFLDPLGDPANVLVCPYEFDTRCP